MSAGLLLVNPVYWFTLVYFERRYSLALLLISLTGLLSGLLITGLLSGWLTLGLLSSLSLSGLLSGLPYGLSSPLSLSPSSLPSLSTAVTDTPVGICCNAD